MTPGPQQSASFAERPLSRRDLLLLPGISLLTMLLMMGSAEWVCRVAWPAYENDTCSAPAGNLPDCVVRMKNPEGPEYVYRFNECGYRSDARCGTKPQGVFRLASLGTSIAMGLYVPAQDLFSNRAAAELTTMLHKPVEAQNMGSLTSIVHATLEQIPAALRLQPDAITIEINPFDLLSFTDREQQRSVSVRNASGAAPAGGWMIDMTDLRLTMRETRAGYMAQHVLLSDDAFFYQSYADYGDPDDVLAQPESTVCERRYAALERTLGEIRERLRGTGVPVFIVPIPNRIAAGMMSDNRHIANRDPDAFQRRLESAARKQGMLTVDTASYFRAVPHAERLYYPVDSHPGPAAHILIGHAVAERLAEYFRTAPARVATAHAGA